MAQGSQTGNTLFQAVGEARILFAFGGDARSDFRQALKRIADENPMMVGAERSDDEFGKIAESSEGAHLDVIREYDGMAG